MTTVPRIPFAISPPGSPTGWGRSISSVNLSSLAPLITRSKKMRNSGRMTRIAARKNNAFMALSTAFRRKVIVPVMAQIPAGGARDHLREDPFGREVHRERHHEEDEPDEDQGGEIDVPDGLGELVGDDRRHRVPRLEQREDGLRAVPDDHRDRHRLSQRPPQAEDGGAEDPREAMLPDHDPEHLPAGAAQREHGVLLTLRDRRQDLRLTDRMNGMIMIERRAPAASMLGPTPAPRRGDRAQVLRHGFHEHVPQDRHEDEDPPQPVDHAGDCREELGEERHGRLHPGGGRTCR